MATVHKVLVKSLKIKHTLKFKNIILVFDQALHPKATAAVILIVVRMGVFHTACTMLSIIGEPFQNAGFRDLCIESGELTEGSPAGVIEGCRYNRGVRLHKLVYEALTRLVLQGFGPG